MEEFVEETYTVGCSSSRSIFPSLHPCFGSQALDGTLLIFAASQWHELQQLHPYTWRGLAEQRFWSGEAALLRSGRKCRFCAMSASIWNDLSVHLNLASFKTHDSGFLKKEESMQLISPWDFSFPLASKSRAGTGEESSQALCRRRCMLSGTLRTSPVKMRDVGGEVGWVLLSAPMDIWEIRGPWRWLLILRLTSPLQVTFKRWLFYIFLTCFGSMVLRSQCFTWTGLVCCIQLEGWGFPLLTLLCILWLSHSYTVKASTCFKVCWNLNFPSRTLINDFIYTYTVSSQWFPDLKDSCKMFVNWSRRWNSVSRKDRLWLNSWDTDNTAF